MIEYAGLPGRASLFEGKRLALASFWWFSFVGLMALTLATSGLVAMAAYQKLAEVALKRRFEELNPFDD